MKKTNLIIGFALLIFCSCEEESKNKESNIGELSCSYTNFRYYNSETISLGEMSEDFILLGVDSSHTENAIRNFILSKAYFDNNYDFEIYSSTGYGYKYLAVKLSRLCNCQEIAWIINEVKENPIINFAHYSIQTDYCSNLVEEAIGEKCVDSYSNLFYVKVIDVNNLSDLNAVLLETNTSIKEQNQFMDDWYTLIADKNSNGDALQMANYFYETGLFSASEPDLIKVVVE